MRGLVLLIVVCAAGPAAAHGDASPWTNSTWTYDPWIIAPLYLSAILYLIGTQRLWRRAGLSRGVRYGQACCFWAGWVALALALISPLHWAGERLFTAHMIEHAVLMVVAAPLIAAARPIGAMLWALPRRLRASVGRLRAQVVRSRTWAGMSHPLGATALHGLAIWAWHMPRLYQTVLDNVIAHRLQHVTFLATALLFWWSLMHARTRARGIAVFCLFVTSLHTGVLGILMTLSRRLWYPEQVAIAAQFGLTPMEDQQLAGLVMGVPMGLIYTGAALAIAARWIVGSSAPHAGARHAVAAH
ncbi:MAG: cytochrome c oxidase assembly protein [Xanthobacteraceae bacterium]